MEQWQVELSFIAIFVLITSWPIIQNLMDKDFQEGKRVTKTMNRLNKEGRFNEAMELFSAYHKWKEAKQKWMN